MVLPLQVMGVPNHRNWKSLKLDAWLVKCRNHQAEFNSFLGNLLHYFVFHLSTFPQLRATKSQSGPCSTTIYIEGGQVLPRQFAQIIALSLVLHSTKNVWPSELRKRGSKNLQPLFHQPVGCLYLIYKRLNHLDSACLRDAGVAPQGGHKPQNCKVEGHKWNQLWFPCAAI